jgi:hypothetical protein
MEVKGSTVKIGLGFTAAVACAAAIKNLFQKSAQAHAGVNDCMFAVESCESRITTLYSQMLMQDLFSSFHCGTDEHNFSIQFAHNPRNQSHYVGFDKGLLKGRSFSFKGLYPKFQN